MDVEDLLTNEVKLKGFLKKYQNVECSIKTLVDNLISFEENKKEGT